MTMGVTAARTSILRNVWKEGNLHPGYAAVLDSFDDDWRDDPLAVQWEESYRDYSAWETKHGRQPTHDDTGAAGLRAWFESQATAELSDRQTRLMQKRIGWVGNVTDPTVQTHYALLAGLHTAGVKPSRHEDRASLPGIVSAWKNATDEAATGINATPGNWGQSHLATYLLFCARFRRQPGRTEPGGRWIRTVRAQERIDPRLEAALSHIPGWRAENELDPVFSIGAERYSEFVKRNHRNPRLRGKTAEERYCARWVARQKRKVKDGTLPAAALGVVGL